MMPPCLGDGAGYLSGLLRELTRSSEPYAQRFRPIATHWRRLIADQRHTLALTAEQRQEIDNPYVVGVPLSAQQAIFVGRSDISQQIEMLLLDRQCPPLLLYGQRRIGKTSLLNNLGRLLPHDIVPLFVDMQGPVGLAATPRLYSSSARPSSRARIGKQQSNGAMCVGRMSRR